MPERRLPVKRTHLLKAMWIVFLGILALTVQWTGPAAASAPRRLYEGTQAMLAVIGTDGNVLVYDATGHNPVRVTTDAVPGQKVYQWPTWATDGRLAFFGASSDPGDSYSLRVFVAESVTAQPKVKTAYTSPDDVFTYAYWSPGNCPDNGGNCRDLALLYTPSDQSGLALRLIRDITGAFTDKVIGQSAPFYYSFAPDGQHMLWYQSGTDLSLYDVEAGRAQRLSDTPGQFQSPMWSPVDDRLLYGVQNEANPNLTDLVVARGAERNVVAHGLDGPLSFAWSPDGTRIAYVAGFDKVTVLNAQSGQSITAGTMPNTVAYYWSPQGDRIAYMVVNRDTPGVQARLRSNGHTPVEQAIGGLSWRILDVQTGIDRGWASFTPSRDMVYMLNFFDQFSRSHRVWSPDGHYLAYSSMDVLGKTTVMLIDTQQSGATPIKVGPGTLGIWSF
ncbi:MAG: TolB family protein [Aggregatilineales bacterium]